MLNVATSGAAGVAVSGGHAGCGAKDHQWLACGTHPRLCCLRNRALNSRPRPPLFLLSLLLLLLLLVRQVLLVTLATMSYMFPHLASIHIYVMGFLALGLLASVNWLLSELKKGAKEAARAGAAPGVAGQLRESDAAPAKAARGKTD